MAAGEYISVASQKDTELADVEKERQQQEAGPQTRAYELEELAQIYVSRGLDYDLAKKARASTTVNIRRWPRALMHADCTWPGGMQYVECEPCPFAGRHAEIGPHDRALQLASPPNEVVLCAGGRGPVSFQGEGS